jgi:hypothetical protein
MRIRTILAAAAVPAALAASLLGTTAASATNPPPPPVGTIAIKTAAQADALSGTTINKNVDIPASVTQAKNVWLSYIHITGRLTVEGVVTMAGDTVDGNTYVSGPGSFLGLTNQASHFGGNVSVLASSGIYQGGPGTMSFGNWTQYNGSSQIDGSLTFADNTGGLYSGGPLHVSGDFVYAGNTVTPTLDRSGLVVDGQSYAS